jgi:hypothetical protein
VNYVEIVLVMFIKSFNFLKIIKNGEMNKKLKNYFIL